MSLSHVVEGKLTRSKISIKKIGESISSIASYCIGESAGPQFTQQLFAYKSAQPRSRAATS